MIGWIATIATFLGVYLTGSNTLWCWPVYLLSNVLWIVYGLTEQQMPLIAMHSMLMVLNIAAWNKWRNCRDRD
ncbi:MAG: nicotinamide mononucleotide transporter [Phycisphaerales bacterium]|nr:nicotinamide mononucleotide transporter [Phycisphaerales bacterium]